MKPPPMIKKVAVPAGRDTIIERNEPPVVRRAEFGQTTPGATALGLCF
jgi:hypothetical protein